MAQTQIQTPGIADGAVTAAKIADGAVGTNEIASGVTITGNLIGTASSVTNGVYTTNFTNSFTGKGFQKMPGGFIIQWGQSSRPLREEEETQTFATPFSSGVFAIVATPISNNPPPGDKRDHWAVYNFGLNGFTLRSYFEAVNGSYTGVFYNWIAIGV